MAKTTTTDDFSKSLVEGLKYPWNKPGRLWYILWALIPIFGWLALIGYVKQITIELIKGQRKELPKMASFWDSFKEGLWVFLFLIPTMLAIMILNLIPVAGNLLALLFQIFLLPWLVMDFFMKGTFESLWNLKKAFEVVFNNAVEFIIALLKTIIFSVVYWILSFVLVGIPCLTFAQGYYLTEFYKKHH